MDNQNTDNRNTTRNQLLEYLDVIDRDTGKQLGYLGDISTSGLMFISQQRWSKGDRLRVRIPLEEMRLAHLNAMNTGPAIDCEYIDGVVVVRWAKPNLNPLFQCFGCEFTDVDPAQFDVIKLLAQHLGVGDRAILNRVQ